MSDTEMAQVPAVAVQEAPEVESASEVSPSPDGSAQGPLEATGELDALRAEAEQMRGALADAESRAKAAELALERERAARSNGLPDELTGFLRGETAEELAAEAATLAKYATPHGAGIGSGGLDPTDSGDSGVVARIIRKSREF
ncbi:hypothetical protein [Streptomyces sp. NPDC059928]|uniref:hypothetical protein n=1 Tax=unclassified Streptomyces TaxID=2593676 RepID=UPI00364DAA96